MHFERKGEFLMRSIKGVVVTILACAMLFAMSATAFAAEDAVVNEPIASSITANDGLTNSITPRTTKTLMVGDGYRNMTGDDLRAPHGNGTFYYRVTSDGYNGWAYQIDCLMYDSNGNAIWRGDNICGVAADGRLEYGGNIVRIDLRITPRAVTHPARSYNITVTY